MADRLVPVDENYRFPTPLEVRLATDFAALSNGKLLTEQIPDGQLVNDTNVSGLVNAAQTGAAIDQRIDVQVTPIVEQITADYIAGDQAVIDAAAAAIDANPKIASLEAKNDSQDVAISAARWAKGALFTNDDLNAKTGEGVQYANTAAISGSIKNKPLWFDTNPFTVENRTLSAVSGILLQEAVQKVPSSPLVRRAYRVSLSGSFQDWQNPVPEGPRQLSNVMITIIGDSQSERSATSWDQSAGTALTGTTFINIARSGDESNTVMLRAGILNLVASVAGNSIPASGTVTLTSDMVVQARENRTIIGGTLNGVPGILAFVSGKSWTFTRSETGAAVPVTGKAVFKSSYSPGGNAQTSAHALIAWFGGNDFAYSFSGQERTIADHVIGNYRRFVEYCQAHGYRPIIAGITNRRAAGAGTDGFAQIQRINTELRRMFPDIFLDVQAYYSQQAIYDAGLVPTAADLVAMGRGEIPPQLFLEDGVHLVPAAHAVIGQYWIAPWLTEKGYGLTATAQPALPVLVPVNSLPADTGWYDVSANLINGWTGELHVRRDGNTVWYRVRNLDPASATAHAFYQQEQGLRVWQTYAPDPDLDAYTDTIYRLARNNALPAINHYWRMWSFVSDEPMPIVMPGLKVGPA